MRRKEETLMRNGRNRQKRKISAGTVFMLAMMAVVITGSVIVLDRLSSGTSVDLSRLRMSVLDIREDPAREDGTETEEQPQMPAVIQETGTPQLSPVIPEKTPVPRNGSESFTLTVGGSISLAGEVRKNSRNADAKVADYADIMMLLAPAVRSDVNIVFLENILSDQHKANDYTAPETAADLVKEAGFDLAACGFTQAYANGIDGIEATISTLESRETGVLGIRRIANHGNVTVRNAKGIRTAFLQYTATVPAKARKTMEKDGASEMIPQAEISRISREINDARDQGAEAVIVLVSWGKNGKEPDKATKELAGQIALAGADLIIGNGSHVPQAAEYLDGPGGRKILCIWSLGSLLTGDRSNIRFLSGYLFHATIRRDGQGGAEVLNPEFTPVYTWKYKQDGRFYYRCIDAGTGAPDGMDKEQTNYMEKAAENVRKVLNGTPLTERQK